MLRYILSSSGTGKMVMPSIPVLFSLGALRICFLSSSFWKFTVMSAGVKHPFSFAMPYLLCSFNLKFISFSSLCCLFHHILLLCFLCSYFLQILLVDVRPELTLQPLLSYYPSLSFVLFSGSNLSPSSSTEFFVLNFISKF